MRKALTLISFLTIVLLLPAQGTWQWINTGYNYILMDITFPGSQDQIGYAVGENSTYNGNGIILKTVDGGNTWVQMNSGTIPGLEAVCFTDTNTGYIGGWQNYFAKTTDGGATWTSSTVHASIWYIKEIDFNDSLNGIVTGAGGMLYVTANGGSSWTAATGLNMNVEDVVYASPTTVFAVGGDEKIAKSLNGGLSWSQVYSGVFQSMFFGVDFYDVNYGIVGGEDGKVLYTSNGGSTWTSTIAGPYTHLWHGVHMFDNDSAVIGGTPEGVYVTGDGGATWTSDFGGGYTYALYKIAYTTGGTGFICGSQGRILRKLPAIQANFAGYPTNICGSDSVTFTHSCAGPVTSWEWSFPGGSPSSFSGPDPGKVFYDTLGSFDVQLIASNSTVSDTLLLQSYVNVGVPDIPSVNGDTAVIENTLHSYTTAFHPGSQYTWYVTGGVLSTGNGTDQMDVTWGAAGTGTLFVTEENMFGCIEDSDTLLVDIGINVGQPAQEDPGISIYPDPAQDWVMIRSVDEITSIILSDISGKALITASPRSPDYRLQLGSISPGIYILNIIRNNGEPFSTTLRKR